MNYFKSANYLMHVKLLKKQLMAEITACWVFFYVREGGWGGVGLACRPFNLQAIAQ